MIILKVENNDNKENQCVANSLAFVLLKCVSYLSFSTQSFFW